VGNVKVLYRSAKGVMSFDKKKPIFQHKSSKVKLELGLGVIDETTLVDKGDYSFAEMKNVVSVLPESYLTVEYFENIGVPHKIYKGTYGNCIFIKEEYLDREFIRAMSEDGTILIQENKRVRNGALNMYYARLDNVIGDWEDITEYLAAKIFNGLMEKNCDLNLGNPYILYAMKRLYQNSIVKAANGVVFATGNFETLAIWGNKNKASMAWLGRRVEDVALTEDIRPEVELLMRENGIL
jgi:hypothetical protein